MSPRISMFGLGLLGLAACGSASDGRVAESTPTQAVLAEDMRAGEYLASLVAFFKRGFDPKFLGLPPEQLRKLEASVTVQLDAKGTVVGFKISKPSGNTAFDATVEVHMKRKVGELAPSPPEDRPDLRRSELSLTLACGSGCS